MKVHSDFSANLPQEVRLSLTQTSRKITSFKNEDFVIDGLFKPSTHLLNNGGKLLRPALLFLGAQAIGERCKDFIDLGAAIELLHVSSLIHDDIIDNGKTRRGVATVNAKYNDSVALLAGNALVSKAIQLSSKYGQSVMDAVSTTALCMSAGELMDYESKKKAAVISIDQYIRLAELKTAALTGTSCDLIAVYRNNIAKNALYEYGFNLGIAFQIRDDILDYLEPEDKHKKDIGANIVTSMKQKYKSSDKKAVEKAVGLNHFYIDKSVKSIKQKKMLKFLQPYTKMVKIQS
jgi:geranylgeranyl pyrophosphate synthase